MQYLCKKAVFTLIQAIRNNLDLNQSVECKASQTEFGIFYRLTNGYNGSATVSQPQALLKTLPTGFLRPEAAIELQSRIAVNFYDYNFGLA